MNNDEQRILTACLRDIFAACFGLLGTLIECVTLTSFRECTKLNR